MKKMSSSILLLSALIVFIFFMADCSRPKITDLKYCCDPGLNAWVIQNKDAFKDYSRSQLCAFSPDTCLAIFRSLGGRHMYDVWKEKLSIARQSLPDAEKHYIAELVSAMSPSIYETAEAKAKFRSFAKNWTERVKSNLKWSDYKVVLLTQTLYTETEIKAIAAHANLLARSLTPQDSEGGYACTCEDPLYCYILFGNSCLQTGCRFTSTGCGTSGHDSCHGTCTSL